MKRWIAGLLTLAVLAIVWWNRQPASRGTQVAPWDTPVACVDRMFLAAADGDVLAYVACFTGAERQQIDRSLTRETGAGAAETLRRTVADLKGWAVVDPPDVTGLSRCSLVVERVYAGRVDRQRLELLRASAGWRISLVDRSQAGQPAIPYGTPVSALEPATAVTSAASSVTSPTDGQNRP